MNSNIDYSTRFIKKEQNQELDNIEENLLKNQNDLSEIINFLNNLLINVEKISKRNNKQLEFMFTKPKKETSHYILPKEEVIY